MRWTAELRVSAELVDARLTGGRVELCPRLPRPAAPTAVSSRQSDETYAKCWRSTTRTPLDIGRLGRARIVPSSASAHADTAVPTEAASSLNEVASERHIGKRNEVAEGEFIFDVDLCEAARRSSAC